MTLHGRITSIFYNSQIVVTYYGEHFLGESSREPFPFFGSEKWERLRGQARESFSLSHLSHSFFVILSRSVGEAKNPLIDL